MSTLLESLDARVNPVWIKEVRQALRGKLFRVGYIVTLLVAGVASTVAAAETTDRVGMGLFLVGYGALATAILGLVPFAAFYATPSDREARSLDLILLSGLTPGQIARGRLLGAGTQSALFFCAFLPFLSLAGVLPGVDLLAALILLVSLFFYSLGVSAASIALGLILRNRLVRALVGLWLSGVLFYLVAGATISAASLLERPQELLDDDAALVLTGMLVPALLMLVYGLGASSAALAHPEENRSTPLRMATVFFALLGCGVLVLANALNPSADAGPLGGSVLIGLLGVPLGVFLTEPDRLGRRVERTLPGPVWTALTSPLLPGGDLAALLAVGLLGGVAVFSVTVLPTFGPGPPTAHDVNMLFTTVAYGVIYLSIPPLLLRPWLHRLPARWAAILGMPGLMVLGLVLPLLMGVLVDDRSLREGDHLGNPFWALRQVHDGRVDQSGVGLVWALAALLVLVQILRGLFGVLRAVRLAERRRDAPQA